MFWFAKLNPSVNGGHWQFAKQQKVPTIQTIILTTMKCCWLVLIGSDSEEIKDS